MCECVYVFTNLLSSGKLCFLRVSDRSVDHCRNGEPTGIVYDRIGTFDRKKTVGRAFRCIFGTLRGDRIMRIFTLDQAGLVVAFVSGQQFRID